MVIDTETTGLTAGRHEIVSIAAVVVDEKTMEATDKFESLIKPMHESHIDPEAMKKNKLKIEDLRVAPTPIQVRNCFYQWHDEMYDGERISPLGHNYSFDKGFLKLFFGDDIYNERFSYHDEDTKVTAKYLQRCGSLEAESLSLSNLCEDFGIPIKAHTALGDVYATLNLYRELIQIGKK
jgi:DNA polymerase III epsilon subunit-like protein